MLLVVDANIILSSLVRGRLTDILLSPKIELIAPELLFLEIRKNKEEIKQKSYLSEEQFEILLAILERRIKIIPINEFREYIPAAQKFLVEHKKDIPYVALALKQKCPFWTYEKRFQKFKDVDCLTTKEVADKIKN